MRRHLLVPLAFLWLVAACSGGTTPATPEGTDPPVTPGPQVVTPPVGETGDGPTLARTLFPEDGATAFITANEKEQLSLGTGDRSYNRGANAGGEFGDAADEASGGAAPGAEDPSTEPEPMPEPDPTREIVEADIFKLEGDLLYILNSYRGLVIIDVANPDRPAIVGRLPFQATPVDMYVREGRAYIVMSDWFEYWQFDPDADPLGFHGSQVLIADVSDPSTPVAVGNLPIDGEVTDTRMVGDVLYAVSKRNPNYWRYNTADWEDTTWIRSLNVSDPEDIREIDRIEFQGTSTLIHAAPHAIFVAAVDPNYYISNDVYEQESLVTYVDIADPDGDIRERGHVYVPGYIADKFKMDYYDKTLRVFSQRWYGSSDATLFAVDVSFPDEMEIVSQLDVAQADYGYLQATRYDGVRAFGVTSRWTSSTNVIELHTFDLSDPRALRKAATLRIGANISHFEVRGDRLIALGQASSYNDYRTQILAFDVADVDAPSQVASVKLGERYSYSSANGDYKAFRIVDELGLILVPLQYSLDVPPYHWQGTRLVDWSNDQLVERGGVENVATVKRAFVVKDRLVAFSERQLQVIDASNRDNPVVTAQMYLIRNVLDIFEIQGQQVQLVGDIEGGGFFFEVLPFGREDDAPILAHLDLPFSSAPFCIREGDVIHMLGYEPDRGQIIRNADFAEVLAPRLRGELTFSDQADSIYRPGYSFYYYYWDPSSGLPLSGRILPFTERHIVELESGRREWTSELRLVDLRDIDNPRIAEGRVPMDDYPFVNKMTHGEILYSTHVEEATTESGESLLYHVRSFVDRIDVTDPDNPVTFPSLNIPGQLVDASDDGTILYTIDYQWDDFGRRRNSLNVLAVDGDVARLVEVVPVSDQVNRAVFRDRTIWLVSQKYPWWGVSGETVASRQPYTVLHQFRVGPDGGLLGEAKARLHGYHFDLLDVEGDRVFLSSTYPYGLLILDASNPTAPVIEHAARSIGYISRVEAVEGYAYTPLGWYGVHRSGGGLE